MISSAKSPIVTLTLESAADANITVFVFEDGPPITRELVVVVPTNFSAYPEADGALTLNFPFVTMTLEPSTQFFGAVRPTAFIFVIEVEPCVSMSFGIYWKPLNPGVVGTKNLYIWSPYIMVGSKERNPAL